MSAELVVVVPHDRVLTENPARYVEQILREHGYQPTEAQVKWVRGRVSWTWRTVPREERQDTWGDLVAATLALFSRAPAA